MNTLRRQIYERSLLVQEFPSGLSCITRKIVDSTYLISWESAPSTTEVNVSTSFNTTVSFACVQSWPRAAIDRPWQDQLVGYIIVLCASTHRHTAYTLQVENVSDGVFLRPSPFALFPLRSRAPSIHGEPRTYTRKTGRPGY